MNDAPSDLSINVNTIAENQDTVSVIDTLSTTDRDRISYTLIEGNADNDSFTLDENIFLTRANFDFERNNSFSVEVTTTNSEEETFVIENTID